MLKKSFTTGAFCIALVTMGCANDAGDDELEPASTSSGFAPQTDAGPSASPNDGDTGPADNGAGDAQQTGNDLPEVVTCTPGGGECEAEGGMCTLPALVLDDETREELIKAGDLTEEDWVCAPPGWGPCWTDSDCGDLQICAPGEQLFYGLAWEQAQGEGFPSDAGWCIDLVLWWPEEPGYEDAVDCVIAQQEGGAEGCEAREGCGMGTACSWFYVPEDDPEAQFEDPDDIPWDFCPGYFYDLCQPLDDFSCENDAECGSDEQCTDGTCTFVPVSTCSADSDCTGDTTCQTFDVCLNEELTDCQTIQECAEPFDEPGYCTTDADCTGDDERCYLWVELLEPAELEEATTAGYIDPDAGICLTNEELEAGGSGGDVETPDDEPPPDAPPSP